MTAWTREWFLAWSQGTRDLRWALRQVRYGYVHRITGKARVGVSELRVRKEPTLVHRAASHPGDAAELSRVVCNPVDRFFPLIDGREDRRLLHLPHIRLLEHFDRHGRLPEDSDYARLLRVRAMLQGRTLGEEAIELKMNKLLATYRSIREKGYRGPGYRRAWIVAMEQSVHPPTSTYSPQGLEVFDGHHRAVVLAHLGVETVEVLMTRAVRMHDFDWTAEPFDEKLWRQAGPAARGDLSVSRP